MLKKSLRNIIKRACGAVWSFRARNGRICPVCASQAAPETAYCRTFCRCSNCNFVWAEDFPEAFASMAFNLVGSWGGIGNGGASDHYLSSMLHEKGIKKHLILGVGATRAPFELIKAGVDIHGSDLSKAVVKYLKENIDADRFYPPSEIRRGFDAVIACEVVEHLTSPANSLRWILSNLNENGVFCGTTDMQPRDEPIDEKRSTGDRYLGYLSYWGHVAYWSPSALQACVNPLGYKVLTLKIQVPGTFDTDQKFGSYYPRKRAFFISKNEDILISIRAKADAQETLPLNNKTYWANYDATGEADIAGR